VLLRGFFEGCFRCALSFSAVIPGVRLRTGVGVLCKFCVEAGVVLWFVDEGCCGGEIGMSTC
jgi:hypothetical protein